MLDKKIAIQKAEENEQVKAGKKAIQINREVFKSGQSEDQKDKDEEEDAEKWHSEG